MNRIIENFLNIHIKEYGLEFEKNIAFEHFINRCIINRYVTDRFDPNDIMTEDGERGVDGIAVIINDKLIKSIEELDDIPDKDLLSVNFIFIQAKTSDSFSSGEIALFTRSIKSFFSPKEIRQKTNEKIENLIKLKDTIYSRSIRFKQPPAIEAYYACCGSWRDDNGLMTDALIDLQPLNESGDYSKVEFIPFDSTKIINSYKEMKKKISRSITMEKKISFPYIEGVSQAYIGVVKCKDFIQLIVNENGNIISNIFEDNVRDFQGYNSVNSEIKATISDKSDQQRFAVLNNGITIVSKNIKITGDSIELFDYQIVNGCQTSYVLYDCRDKINESSYVVIKIIDVSNEEISDRIIFTTNRQTEVKAEAFTATKLFHKRLQDYYNAMNDLGVRLYYERRSKQYDLDDNIEKTKVVTLANQIQTYVAMFLNEPHSTHRYYGELLRQYNKKLFLDSDGLDLYYASSCCYYFVDLKFKAGMYNHLKRFKYHIILAIKVLAVGSDVIFGCERRQKRLADKLFDIIKKSHEFDTIFKSAVSCVEATLNEFKHIPVNERHRSRDITNGIIKQAEIIQKAKTTSAYLKKGNILQGTVVGVDRTYINITLKTEDCRKDGYIHISQVAGQNIRNLRNIVKLGDILQVKILSESYYDNQWGWELTMLINE